MHFLFNFLHSDFGTVFVNFILQKKWKLNFAEQNLVKILLLLVKIRADKALPVLLIRDSCHSSTLIELVLFKNRR